MVVVQFGDDQVHAPSTAFVQLASSWPAQKSGLVMQAELSLLSVQPAKYELQFPSVTDVVISPHALSVHSELSPFPLHFESTP